MCGIPDWNKSDTNKKGKKLTIFGMYYKQILIVELNFSVPFCSDLKIENTVHIDL